MKVPTLGYSMEEVPQPVTYQFFTERLHPEDYESTMEAMKRHLQGEKSVYEAEYRIRPKLKDGSGSTTAAKLPKGMKTESPYFWKAIMNELNGRIMEASVNKTPLSIIMLDIDKFKILNDIQTGKTR